MKVLASLWEKMRFPVFQNERESTCFSFFLRPVCTCVHSVCLLNSCVCVFFLNRKWYSKWKNWNYLLQLLKKRSQIAKKELVSRMQVLEIPVGSSFLLGWKCFRFKRDFYETLGWRYIFLCVTSGLTFYVTRHLSLCNNKFSIFSSSQMSARMPPH